MPVASNLTKRAGVFYYRARVPADLIKAYGRPMVSLSLETTNLTEAHARATTKRAQLQVEFDRLGRIGRPTTSAFTGALLHLSDADIEQLCLRYRAQTISKDEEQRLNGFDSHFAEFEGDVEETGNLPYLRKNYATGRLTAVYPDLQDFLKSIDVRVPVGTPPYERLAQRFQTAQIEVREAILRRRRGEVADVPEKVEGALSFKDVLDRWKAAKADRPLKTVRAFEQAFELFQSTCLAANAETVRYVDSTAFRDKLINDGGMSRRNVAKLLTFLREAFQVSLKDRKLASNPFDGIEVQLSEAETQGKKRLPFTVAELNTIFAGPVYQPDFKPRDSLGAACHWLPLLAPFTGARLEELAQLHAEDIQWDPDHGWFLLLHAEGERQLKNISSHRRVPVHPELSKLGFLKYVEGKTGRLFPALRPDKYNKLATSFSTWFGLYLDGLKIVDERKVFHSSRHSFVNVCKQRITVIPAEVREAIVGHLSKDDIENVYGEEFYPLEPMVAAMKLVEFKGLQISHLYER